MTTRAGRSSGNKTGEPNLYDLLGVSSSATQKEIKSAYRKLAKVNHPDAGGDPEKFKAIAKAYAVLSTPEARSEYDRQQSFFGSQSKYNPYSSSVEDTFDFFASKAKEDEEFYGLGDLFRDIEEEFGGISENEDGSGIFKKLGEDLLDFLEGNIDDPKTSSKTTNNSSSTTYGTSSYTKKESSQQSDGARTTKSGSSSSGGGGGGTRGASSYKASSSSSSYGKGASKSQASFDADQELEELKRQMGKM